MPGDNPPPPHQPPSDGGEFLLHLLQNRHHQQQQQHSSFLPHNTFSSSHSHSLLDPAVAAVGPSVPIPHHHHNNHHRSPQTQTPNFFSQGFPPRHSPPPSSSQTSSFFTAPHHHFNLFQNNPNLQGLFGNFTNNINNTSHHSSTSSSGSNVVVDGNDSVRLKKLEFERELLKERELNLGLGSSRRVNANGFDPNRNRVHGLPDQRRSGSGPPPGFSNKLTNERRGLDGFNNVGSREMSNLNHNERQRSSSRLSGQLDHPGLPAGSSLLVRENGGRRYDDEVVELSEQLVDCGLGEEGQGGGGGGDEKNDVTSAKKKHHRDKDFRSDARGQWILSQRRRISMRMNNCRGDINQFDTPFLALYESLIPPEEERLKQKQLLTLLEKLVCKEWPNAKLYLYGSCANSFGVSKSDIDVCLAIDDQNINKSELLLKLADILQSDNLQDVQALTRARVPIVKLMDPVTGISCDICINNVLAVVNTKLLRDYAEIDARLRQLAFLVKHWAKSRGVNETYQGTLSSYAYVLMCIHFLQQRNPPILPCLQGMEPTYAVTVDDVECAFCDQVERLRDFGARNKENISKLLWGFFSYWAYCHDYANNVISVRTGCILSKVEKNWTRRIGNDRHLICIEDPFETSHDLGRVVDKHSIRVLREEFERAADIMQNSPNPCVALFEPYIP